MKINMNVNVKLLLVCNNFRKFCTSALFIPGNKASNTFAVLTPYIDFEQRIEKREELVENLKLRSSNIVLSKVEKQWTFYKYLENQKHILEFTKNEISAEIATLLKDPVANAAEIVKLKLHAKLAKNDYKNLKDYFYGVEELAILKVLSLPNVLHWKTPKNKEQIHCICFNVPGLKSKYHLDIAQNKDLIEFSECNSIYLKNEAALFELALLNYTNNFLLDSNFHQFSNSDFVRSIVVEGCGANFLNGNEIFTLEDAHNDVHHREVSRAHLVGGASLYSFMAYFTKHTVQQSYFPLKYFVVGRNYSPVGKNRDLLRSDQSSQVNCFVAVQDDDALMDKEFDALVGVVQKFYEIFGLPFRLVYVPAKEINKNESLKLSIQMYSCYVEDYVEVGFVSIFDNFISKRLLFNYYEEKERKFPKVIFGSIVNVQKLLACVLEYKDAEGGEILCDLLKQYTPL